MRYREEQSLTTKCHYKMYKAGKNWVIAGITLTTIGLGIFDQIDVHADVQETAKNEVTSTTESSDSSNNTYVLKQGTDTSEATVQSSASTTKETSNSTSKITSTSSVSSQSGVGSSTDEKQDPTQRTGYALKQNSDNGTKTSSNSGQQQTNLNAESTINQVGETKDPIARDQNSNATVFKNQTGNIDKEVDPNLTKKQANKEKYEQPDARDLASGTSGTCDWVITDDGVLKIGPGKLGEVISTSSNSFWIGYADKIKIIDFTGQVEFPKKSSYLFSQLKKLESILHIENVDTSNVTSMAYMFYFCSNLTNLDLTDFDTSNVTTMAGMFNGCSNLTNLDVTNFDTSKVKDMSAMFATCGSLTSLNVTNFDTSNVMYMDSMFNMFNRGSSLTSLDVSSFNTSSVQSMHAMFYGCSSLTSLDVSNFNTSFVQGMRAMFHGCSNLTTLDLSNFDTTNVTNMTDMFTDCISLNTLELGTHSIFNATTGLPEPNFDGTSNHWQAVANGTTEDPRGDQLYTSAELTSQYDGSKPDTYVIAPLRTTIDGHDSTIVAGPNQTWTASDNFTSAIDAKGHAVDVADVQVEGTVNPQVPGTYDITYSYTDELGNEVSETITVTVVASQLSVDGHDSTIIAGPNQTWTASDNFDGATDAKGNPVGIDDVTVTGTVDPQTPGSYDITYSYTDEVGNQVSKTITVTVIAGEASATITYVDGDGTVVETKTIDGTDGDNVNYTIDVPEGYEIDDSQTDYQNGDTITITLTGDDTDNVIVHLKHGEKHIDPSDPAYADETNWTVNQTVHYVDENGNKLADDTVNTLHYTRDIVVDAVTGEIIERGTWTSAQGNDFIGFDVPTIDGYEAEQASVPTMTVTVPASEAGNPGTSADIELTIHYYPSETDVVDPSEPEQPDTPNQPDNPVDSGSEDNTSLDQDDPDTTDVKVTNTNTKATSSNQVSAKQLPQTGDREQTTESTVGILGLLVGTLGLFGLGRKRRR